MTPRSLNETTSHLQIPFLCVRFSQSVILPSLTHPLRISRISLRIGGFPKYRYRKSTVVTAVCPSTLSSFDSVLLTLTVPPPESGQDSPFLHLDRVGTHFWMCPTHWTSLQCQWHPLDTANRRERRPSSAKTNPHLLLSVANALIHVRHS